MTESLRHRSPSRRSEGDLFAMIPTRNHCRQVPVDHPPARSRVLHRVASMLRGLFCCGLLLSQTAPQSAQGQPHPSPRASLPQVPDEAPRAAMESYRKGRQAYLAGHYAEALVHLKRALQLDPTSPSLMHQVARTSELLEQHRAAIHYYRRYLRALPRGESEERERIRIRIRLLQLQQHKGESRPAVQRRSRHRPLPKTEPSRSTPPQTGRGPVTQLSPFRPYPQPTPPFPPDGPPHTTRPLDDVIWTAAGTGVGLLLAGTLTGVWAVRKHDAVDTFVLGVDGTPEDRNTQAAQAARLSTAANLMLGAGGVALATALVMFLLDDEPPSARLSEKSLTLHF